MPSEITARLASRSALAGLVVSSAVGDRLVAYYELLQRWNRKINLTSLSNPDEAIDRLLLEPIAAAAVLPQSPRLIDLGSGGGSPAIPLALMLSARLLVMVESRSRKAAFLREAVRELGLTATVENARFEQVVLRADYCGAMDLVSVRAVRINSETLSAAAACLSSGGRVALFHTAAAQMAELPVELSIVTTVPLLHRSTLTVLLSRDVPRGTL